MTRVTVKLVESGQLDDTAPPAGAAIVRPLRHVRAVRARHLQRFPDPAEAAASRSARAWAWALGEIAVAPVTDRKTRVPPSRTEIEAEIGTADERRLRGDRENRADAAATILRWLIGLDDHIPVCCDNPGELVGGLGDIVRTREEIADTKAVAVHAQRRAMTKYLDTGTHADERHDVCEAADLLDGVIVTLTWVCGERIEAPVTRVQPREVTAKALKQERVHAEDVIQQGRDRWAADWLPPRWYGEGVKFTIDWLLGDSTAPPVA